MSLEIEGIPVSPDFDVTPELDAAIDRLAHRAKADVAARNALYEVFAFKTARFARQVAQRTDLHACEPADVEQEAFLVFCELVRRWRGVSSFAGYYFSWFPTMLRQAVARLEHGRPAGTQPVDADDQVVGAVADDLRLLLVDSTVDLSERERAVLELRVTAGLRMTEIAALLDCNPRTVRRILQRVQARAAVPGAPRAGRA